MLPASIRSFVVEDQDGDYTILINESLSISARFQAFQHEMAHIECCDFELCTADEAERKEYNEKNETAKWLRADYQDPQRAP